MSPTYTEACAAERARKKAAGESSPPPEEMVRIAGHREALEVMTDIVDGVERRHTVEWRVDGKVWIREEDGGKYSIIGSYDISVDDLSSIETAIRAVLMDLTCSPTGGAA